MDNSILEVVLESARDLYDAGFMKDVTMRDFEKLCSDEQDKSFPEVKTPETKK